MLNKNVIDVLTQLNNMTNSIILKYPKTIAISESQDMMALFDVSYLDKDEFPDIGLKDSLSDFLNLIKLFPDDRVITVNGNTINIVSGDLSATFIMDNIALLDAYNKDESQFIKTEQAPSVATFNLTPEDIKNIKTSATIFKDLTEVIFTSCDGDVKISLGATNKFNAKSNTFSITKSCKANKEFEVKIPVENFKSLPHSEYVVDIKYNSTRNSYRILMTSKSLEYFKIILTVKV